MGFSSLFFLSFMLLHSLTSIHMPNGQFRALWAHIVLLLLSMSRDGRKHVGWIHDFHAFA
jgi:hypothetical protein